MTRLLVCAVPALMLALACSSPESQLFQARSLAPDNTPSAGDNSTSASGGTGNTEPGPGGAGMPSSGAGMPSSGAGMPGGGGTPSGAGAPGVAGAPPVQGGAGGTPDPGAGGAGGVIVEPVCGNGVIEGEEECDGGVEDGVEGCTSQCEVDCSDYDDEALESEDHHCYAGYDEDDWAGARDDCAERGGYLVTVSSAEENELITELVQSSKWIGAFEDLEPTEESEGVYEWVNGEPFDYENWDAGQPDGDSYRCSSGRFCYEHCVSLSGDGEWEDERCSLIDGYICEWDPPGSK